MKKSSFLSSLSIAALFSIAPVATDLAAAQCLQIDTGVQISISGGGPAQQTNTVDMGNPSSCGRNATVTTGTQIHVGPDRAVQNRSVRQSVQEGERSLRRSSYPLQIQVNPQIHVDNPADRLNSNQNPAIRYREQLRLIE